MSHAVPQLQALRKEGEAGRRKITQYTRYFTVVLAVFQSFGVAMALQSQSAGAKSSGGDRSGSGIHPGGCGDIDRRNGISDVAG